MDMKSAVSPKIKGLMEAISAGDCKAIDGFWKAVEENGTPIVEEIPGDSEHVLVTVVWKDAGDIETIAVFGEMFGMNTDEEKLEKLLDTNLWYKTYKLPANGRSLYVFFINEQPGAELADIEHKLDPFNPHIVTCVDDEENPGDYCILFKQESMIELPKFKNNPYVQEKAEAAKGSIEQLRFGSKILDKSKRIWLYKPANYDELQQPYGLAIFMDGFEYLYETKAAVVLDNMIAEGVIPPMAAVFVDNRDNRIEELRLNTVFIDFLAKELVPWAKEKCKISDDSQHTLVGGFSAGGVTAAYAALLYPEVFGKVLSQSGAFYWGYNDDMTGSVVVDKYEQAGRQPIDIYMALGEFEKFDHHLNAANRLYKILTEKGYGVKYEEFMGGHTSFDCQITLAEGLEFLLGK
ncbi:MAG: enterochelin esterase [Clostridia bacterium]|jgi:enterochelin esterase family protein|nr:enterochelin esterase [Clostridia bacterium]